MFNLNTKVMKKDLLKASLDYSREDALLKKLVDFVNNTPYSTVQGYERCGKMGFIRCDMLYLDDINEIAKMAKDRTLSISAVDETMLELMIYLQVN